MELVLALLGILLTIALSGPVISVAARTYRDRRQRRRWSADLQVERGAIPKLENYAYERWHQVIRVDDAGNAVHSVEAKLVNIGQRLLESITFPVYCDAVDVPESAIEPWVRRARASDRIVVEDWLRATARGRLRVLFQPAIKPGGWAVVRWGYTLPSTFRPGDEYYNWDIATLHFEIRGELRFASSWSIGYARWRGKLSASQTPPAVRDSTITWKVAFPQKGERVTMEFGLIRRAAV